MIFTSPGPALNVDHLREDVTIPQFILDEQHPLRAHRGTNSPWFIDVCALRRLLFDGAPDL